MTAATLDLTMECGADFSQTLILKDSNNAAINLSGYTFASMIKISAADAAALVRFTCAIVGDGSTGQVTLTLTDEQTTALFSSGDNPTETTTLIYDIIQTVGGLKSRIVQGNITLVPGVTL